MSATFKLFTLFKAFMLTVVLASYGTLANAQNLRVSGNSVTISVPGTSFSQNATISNAGVVSAVTGVPTTGTLTTPTFSFTMVQTGSESTNGTYAVGIILDEQGSQRRLEVFIPTVTFTFDAGGNLTGSLGAQNVNIYGRDSTGATTAETNVASAGSVAFNGSTLSFSAADQISLIQAQGGILADITTSINNTGLTYDYTVILANTAGTNHNFQHTDLTGFPASGAEFVIGAGDNIILGTNGQKLTGTVTFAAAAGGGGAGGGDDDEVDINEDVEAITDTANTLLDAEITADSAANYTSTIATIRNQLVTLNAKVAANPGASVNANLALQLSTTLKNLIQFAADIAESPATTLNNDTKFALSIGVNQALLAALELYNALSGTALTAAERGILPGDFGAALSATQRLLRRAYIGSSALNAIALTDVSALSIPSDEAQAIVDLVASAQDALTGLLFIIDNEVDADLATEVTELSQVALEVLLTNVGADLGLSIDFTTDAAAQQLFSDNPTLLSRLLDAVAINVGGSSEINTTTTRFTFQAAGLSSDAATVIADELAVFVEPSGLTLGSTTASSELRTALGASSLTIDSVSGALTATIGGNSFEVFLSSVSPAPTALPEGQFIQPDGSSLIIDDGYAYVLVPAPSSHVNFASAINAAGSFTTSIDSTGTLSLSDAGTAAIFSASMSSAAVGTGTGTGNTTFSAATGDPADASYVIGVTFADGTTQDVVPAIADPLFFQSVANAGFQVSTDLSTGLIDIAGFLFRPDYFQTPLSVADSLYRFDNSDSSGVAYRAVDANNDGVTDYQILTSTGVQTVYGQP